jgi:Trypsin
MTGRFASSSASSSLLLLLVFVVATFLSLAAATGFEVDPEKVVFFDGAVGINETTDPDHSATTRIVGGDVANESRYPYYTALFDFIPAVGGLVYHGCGGSLVRDDVVITAGKCC